MAVGIGFVALALNPSPSVQTQTPRTLKPHPPTSQVDFHGSWGKCRGGRAGRPRRRGRRGTYPLNPV